VKGDLITHSYSILIWKWLLQSYKDKSPGIDQIPAELSKAVGRTIHCEIHRGINAVWNKGEINEWWKG
jgi:hypothetical protein